MNNTKVNLDEPKAIVSYDANTVTLREHLELQLKYTENLVSHQKELTDLKLAKEKSERLLTEKFNDKANQLFAQERKYKDEKMNEVRDQLKTQKSEFPTIPQLQIVENKVEAQGKEFDAKLSGITVEVRDIKAILLANQTANTRVKEKTVDIRIWLFGIIAVMTSIFGIIMMILQYYHK